MADSIFKKNWSILNSTFKVSKVLIFPSSNNCEINTILFFSLSIFSIKKTYNCAELEYITKLL